jgi:uncharacterized Zn finger protein (UPF0148 family)
MNIYTCPNCKNRVLAKADGTCPHCRMTLTEPIAQDAETSMRSFRDIPVKSQPRLPEEIPVEASKEESSVFERQMYWKEILKGEAVRSPSASEGAPSSRKIQKGDSQIRGWKDVLAGIGGGIFLILLGTWGLIEGPKLEVWNGLQRYIPIASGFNLVLGFAWLWKVMKGSK